MMWIEMSRDEVHGGGDWAFAKCVWSPTHKNNKKRNQTWLFWENVKKVKEGDSIEEQIDHVERCVPTSEALAQLKKRIGHEKFAENVRKNYGNHCCFPNCDVTDNNFLIVSHIARWADNERKRGEISNGLCLCLIHDTTLQLFEK